MHYTVKTRRGFHVYFKYDKTIKSINIDKVDLQNDNKLIIGETTSVIRYNKEKYSYTYMGGLILEMPKKIRDICVLHKDADNDIKKYTSKIKYDYEISDEEIRDIIEQIKEKHPEYLTDYNLWLKYTTVMKTIDKFDIWDEVNKQFSGYSRQNNLNIWKNIKMSISPNFFCRLLKMPLINFSKKVERLDSLINKDDCTVINQRYFELPDEDDFENDIIVIQSGTGTGKTTCVADNFYSYQLFNSHITLLSIVNLISLADQQLKTFKEKAIDIHSYDENNCNPSLIMAQHSVICINSLFKLHNCDFSNKVIYIDEVHSLINSLTHNNTITFQKLVYNTLLRAINTCHKVIVSDAHIMNSTMLHIAIISTPITSFKMLKLYDMMMKMTCLIK
ncbi:MAG: hypothetical protein EOO99_12040 [Pedobacter sp.]|nr:MAG: hypothetical protein EOO99_12040 [Pedobacter sp.]